MTVLPGGLAIFGLPVATHRGFRKTRTPLTNLGSFFCYGFGSPWYQRFPSMSEWRVVFFVPWDGKVHSCPWILASTFFSFVGVVTQESGDRIQLLRFGFAHPG